MQAALLRCFLVGIPSRTIWALSSRPGKAAMAIYGGPYRCDFRWGPSSSSSANEAKLRPRHRLYGFSLSDRPSGAGGNFVNVEAFGSKYQPPWGSMTGERAPPYLSNSSQWRRSVSWGLPDAPAPAHPLASFMVLWCALGLLLLSYTKQAPQIRR